jgi:hypothetical protein
VTRLSPVRSFELQVPSADESAFHLCSAYGEISVWCSRTATGPLILAQNPLSEPFRTHASYETFALDAVVGSEISRPAVAAMAVKLRSRSASWQSNDLYTAQLIDRLRL